MIIGEVSEQSVKKELRDRLNAILGGEIVIPDVADVFSEMGLDSISMMMVTSELEEVLDIELPAHVLWDFPTLTEFSRFLLSVVPHDRLAEFVHSDFDG